MELPHQAGIICTKLFFQRYLAESPEDYTDRTGCVAVIEDVSCTDYDGKTHSYSKDDDKE